MQTMSTSLEKTHSNRFNRKIFRVDPAVSTRIFDHLVSEGILFREEAKGSKPKSTMKRVTDPAGTDSASTSVA
jgi:hypothetical protein